MATLMDPDEGATGPTGGVVAGRPPRFTTTLYDFITALQEVVGANDALVVATIVHLLQSRRLTWRREARGHLSKSP